jgi:hypothetical protein
MARTAHEIQATVSAEREVPREELEDIAEELLDVLHQRARLVAMGPAISVDFATRSISVLYTVEAESPSEVYDKGRFVAELIEDAANSFQLRESQTSSAELVGA